MKPTSSRAQVHACLVDLRTTRQAMIRAGDLGSAVLGIASELGFLKAVARESQLMAECVSTQASQQADLDHEDSLVQ